MIRTRTRLTQCRSLCHGLWLLSLTVNTETQNWTFPLLSQMATYQESICFSFPACPLSSLHFLFVSPFPHSYPYLQPGRHRACSEITYETKGSHGSVSGQTPSRVQPPQAPPTVLSSRPPHPFISIPSPSPLH